MRLWVNVKWGATLGLGALVLGLLSACTTADVKPASPESQRVQAVLDHWTQALGGVPLLEKLQGLEVRANVVLAAGGGKFEVHAWQTADNRYRTELAFPNGTSLVEAYDGKYAWRKSNVFGFGFVSPAELETNLRRDSIRAALNVGRDYPTRHALADVTVGDRVCRVLSLAPRAGPPERWSFDAENGRLLRIERGQGAATETLDFSDYRAVNGVVLPYGLSVKSAKNSYAMQRIEVVADPLVGDSLWTPPAEVLREGLKVAGILDRYLASVGGVGALARIRTRVTQQDVEMPATGVKYHVTLSQKLPNLALIEENLPGLGPVTQGYDGVTGWVNSDLQGYRELKGAELRQVTETSDLRTISMLAERCPLRRLMGPREVNGKRTTALALATMQGSAGLYYFSDTDGRLLRIESTVPTGPQGTMAVIFDFSDFRAVDGVVMPFMTTATNPAVTSVTKIQSVKHNVALPDAMFKPRKDES